jgi:hypothetical protein
MRTKLLIALIFPLMAYSQFQNSGEVEVYSIDNADISKIEISGGETSLEYNFYTWQRNYVLAALPAVPSAQFVNGLTFKVGLSDAEKFINLNDFKFSDQGFLVGFNYIHSVEQIFETAVPNHYFNIWTYKLGVEFKQDNFKNFDPLSLASKTEKPITFSINASATRYCFFFNQNLALGFALNGTYLPKTYNSSNMLNFKELGPGVISSTTLVAFKDFDGKFGTIDNSVSGGNISFSVPIFIDYSPTKFYPYVVPVPYASAQYLSSDSPTYYGGFSLGFFPKAIFSAPTPKPVGAGGALQTTRTFNSPAFLSFGVDWSVQGKDSSHPNYFVTGTISFD